MGDPAGTSVIRLHRSRDFQRLRAYRVRIDGDPVGKIAAGETMDFPVPPGEHRVRLTLDKFWGSRPVVLQVREGELAEFACRPGTSLLFGLTALLAAFCGEMLGMSVWNHVLWAWFALPLCLAVVLLLVRHRYIRLDGPAVTS
jgi:hypothetical protein